MVEYTSPGKKSHTQKPQRTKVKGDKVKNLKSSRCKKLAQIGKKSAGIINKLCNPIDVTNRFINLTLQTIDENSQGREFLLESKRGIRQTSDLLRRLNRYAKEIEREISEISGSCQQSECPGAKRRQARTEVAL